MEGFFDGLEQAVRKRNWHAALVLALTLPDICTKASDPDRTGTRRPYVAWFETFVAPAYTRYAGSPGHREEIKYLSGADCYGLRCALLHEGSDDTTRSARDALDEFYFCTPGDLGNTVHMNKSGRALNLMVDQFALDMLDGARRWWATLSPEQQAGARAGQITLHSTDGDIAFG
ncbi:hypothetical protein [Streptomyces sp. NPDC059850]|uniref:hypothetical protein n=1 Tax=Streptomyces sp. NPDC059850 TaxID=3346970 RepID=UPI00364CB4EA